MLVTPPTRSWVVLRMLSGCALTAATALAWGGHDVFCPVTTIRRQGRGATRNKTVTKTFPMLPGYLFVRPDDRFRPSLVDTPRLRITVMSAQGAWLAVPERQIDIVRAMERERQASEIFTGRPLATGDTVRVIRGILSGDLLRVVRARGHRAHVLSPRTTKPFSIDASLLEVAYA